MSSVVKPRGTCSECGRDVAVYGSQRLAWYHNRPGRIWPPCEGQRQPAQRNDRTAEILAIADDLDLEDDPAATDLANALRRLAARRTGSTGPK